jgi:plastocyanin
MTKGPAFVATVVTASFVALAVPAIVMMAMVMGTGNAGMMGSGDANMMSGMMGGMMGGGSDPGRETPVAGATQVRIENLAFSPANIVIDVGTTVTWTNYDSLGHTVTSDGGGELDSPLLGKNRTFSHTFDKPGEYRYHCKPHPSMQGLVTVRAPAAGPGATPGSP